MACLALLFVARAGRRRATWSMRHDAA